MKVVILAGGLGTRISEETHLKPKPMIEIGGRPILWHIMNLFSEYGHKDFYIATGYKSEIIEKYFSDHLDSGSMISMDGKNHSQICGLFREMAVNSYKLTEYVMTNKLGFVPIPGYYDGNVDV